ncbi:MAG: dethiobiotin synthase [Candidatus Abyssubacteria bacterium]
MTLPLFITGTDTDVGKTVVAAGLALAFRKRGLDVGVMKPAATGCRSWRGTLISEDVEYLRKVSDCEDEPALVCPYLFREPLAPEVAAKLENRRIDVRRIIRTFDKLRRRHEMLIVEGAGGLFVPVKRNYFMIDLIVAMNAVLVIVARPGLGTINHTLLSCASARERGIEVAGVIISNYPARPSLAERTNPDSLRRYAGAPLLGILPHLPGVSVATCGFDGLLEATESNIDLDVLLKRIRRR